VKVTLHLDPELDHVFLVRSSFDQAIVNLIVNGRDAMPHGGTLVITTREMVLDEAAVRRGAPGAGAYVAVLVTDTGCGIRPEHVPQVFDPFFTTKAAGNGTGLGLTTVYAFIRNSGGHLDVTSTVGKGTTISLFFPSGEAHALVSKAPSDAAPESHVVPLREAPFGATLSGREQDAPPFRASRGLRTPFGPLR
jgi:signal transduction histidine kinase